MLHSPYKIFPLLSQSSAMTLQTALLMVINFTLTQASHASPCQHDLDCLLALGPFGHCTAATGTCQCSIVEGYIYSYETLRCERHFPGNAETTSFSRFVALVVILFITAFPIILCWWIWQKRSKKAKDRANLQYIYEADAPPAIGVNNVPPQTAV